jgi:hypothetical protein
LYFMDLTIQSLTPIILLSRTLPLILEGHLRRQMHFALEMS